MAIEADNAEISLARQCDLLGLPRSSLYYRSCREDSYDQELMRLLDEQYLRTPFYGVERMTATLRRGGHGVNGKRVRRLMRQMGAGGDLPQAAAAFEPSRRGFPAISVPVEGPPDRPA